MGKRDTLRDRLLVGVLLAAMVLPVYLQVRGFEFLSYDDDRYVTQNRRVLSGLTREGISWAVRSIEVSNWHPLTWLSHMTDVALFGTNAGAHHLVNVAFHGLNALLLFLVLHRMTGAPWRSGVVAALFAVHPLHVESVAWVSERKDVLSTLFWMLTMWAYVGYARRPGFLRYLPVFLFLAFGLMAKAMPVTLPFVLLLLDAWPLGRIAGMHSTRDPVGVACPPARIPFLLAEKVPLLALSAAGSILAYTAQHAGETVVSLDRIPLATRAGNALVSYGAYLWKTFWPSSLAIFYPYRDSGIPLWKLSCAATGIVAMTGLAIWQFRRRPYVAVGWFWYLGTLVPVIGWVQLGMQSMADRYTYVPLIGIFVALVWFAADSRALARLPRMAVLGVVAALLLSLSVAAHVQAGRWKDSVTLFRHAVTVTEGNWLAYQNLGMALGLQGRHEEALSCFRESIRLNPAYDKSHYNCGTALMILGRYPEAAACFQEALRLRPAFAHARANLGIALLRSGVADEGIRQLREALRLDPSDPAANFNLAVALIEVRAYDESVELLQRYRRIRPGDVKGLLLLGDALKGQGRKAEALARYVEAGRIAPADPDVRRRLAERGSW